MAMAVPILPSRKMGRKRSFTTTLRQTVVCAFGSKGLLVIPQELERFFVSKPEPGSDRPERFTVAVAIFLTTVSCKSFAHLPIQKSSFFGPAARRPRTRCHWMLAKFA